MDIHVCVNRSAVSVRFNEDLRADDIGCYFVHFRHSLVKWVRVELLHTKKSFDKQFNCHKRLQVECNKYELVLHFSK